MITPYVAGYLKQLLAIYIAIAYTCEEIQLDNSVKRDMLLFLCSYTAKTEVRFSYLKV